MFFSENVLTRKGPLANIWLAAHWDRKLSKAQIVQTDIEGSVDEIIRGGLPPMALRLSGQLLLGASRIYWRKARYLLEDCSETLDRIKLNFKLDAQVDMPQDQARAPASSITLATTFNTTAANMILQEPELDLDEILNMVATQPSGGAMTGKDGISLKEKFNLNKTFGFEREFSAANDSLLQAFPGEIEAGRRLTADLSGMNMSRDTNPFLSKDSPAAPFGLEDPSTPRLSIEAGRREASLGLNESLAFSPMRLSAAGAGTKTAANDFGMAEGLGDWDVQGELNVQSAAQPADQAQQLQPFNTPPRPKAASKLRKRKVAMDEVTELASSVIQKQVKDTSDITTAAAASKRPLIEEPVVAAAMEESRRQSLVPGVDAAMLLSRPGLDSDLVMDAFGDLFKQAILPAVATPARETAPQYPASSVQQTPAMPPLTPLPRDSVDVPMMDDGYEAPMFPEFDGMTPAGAAPMAPAPSAPGTATVSLDILSACTGQAKGISFQTLVSGQSRSVAAKTFFEVLALSSRGAITAEQQRAFGSIGISARAMTA